MSQDELYTGQLARSQWRELIKFNVWNRRNQGKWDKGELLWTWVRRKCTFPTAWNHVFYWWSDLEQIASLSAAHSGAYKVLHSAFKQRAYNGKLFDLNKTSTYVHVQSSFPRLGPAFDWQLETPWTNNHKQLVDNAASGEQSFPRLARWPRPSNSEFPLLGLFLFLWGDH